MKSTLEIDWESESDLVVLLHKVKSQLGTIRGGEGKRKERAASQFDACKLIYDTDITKLYSALVLDPNPVYYVYVHMNTARKIVVEKGGKSTFAATLGMSHQPFYVGKGTGNRCYELGRSETHRKIRSQLRSLGKEVKVHKVVDKVSEAHALALNPS